MYILGFKIKEYVSALYGHQQDLFFLKVLLYKCDVEISHPIIILVCLCRRVLYYICMYIVYISLLVEGGEGVILGVLAGCQHLLLQGVVAVARLSIVGPAGTFSPVGGT